MQAQSTAALEACDVATDAQARGYSEVQAYAGWQPLETWQPYGKRSGHKGVRFVLDLEASAIRERPTGQTFPDDVFGYWPIR